MLKIWLRQFQLIFVAFLILELEEGRPIIKKNFQLFISFQTKFSSDTFKLDQSESWTISVIAEFFSYD